MDWELESESSVRADEPFFAFFVVVGEGSEQHWVPAPGLGRTILQEPQAGSPTALSGKLLFKALPVLTWNGDDDRRATAGTLGRNLGFGNAQAIHSLADNLDRLLKAAQGDVAAAVCGFWNQRDLGSTLEIKTEPGVCD